MCKTSEKLKLVMELLRGGMDVTLRISLQGVPHLVVKLSDDSRASVAWFWGSRKLKKPQKYRVFHPYAVRVNGEWGPQDRFDCLTPEEVVAQLQLLQKGVLK